VRVPRLSIVIPTCNRAGLLERAVRSALAQSCRDVEIIVVDDAADQPARLPIEDARVRILRLPRRSGHAAARNVGTREARAPFVAYLDDDDELLPWMAELSLKALQHTVVPQPVAVLSALQVVRPDGSIRETRLPPTLPKGSHFSLEEIPADRSFQCKQTLVVARDVLLGIGGWDEQFRSRVHTELFLRLNAACAIIGLREPTYRLHEHAGQRLSRNPRLRQESFALLLRKHRTLIEAHPRGFARLLTAHARASWRLGQRGPAVLSVLRAFSVDPLHTLVGGATHAGERLGLRRAVTAQ
jgi:glycosyltransferase involved in cell wall biosynthesis